LIDFLPASVRRPVSLRSTAFAMGAAAGWLEFLEGGAVAPVLSQSGNIVV
jgi:hypothetical protein